MDMKSTNTPSVYAKTLQILSMIFFSLIVLGYILYLAGVLPAFGSPEVVINGWHLDAQTFRESNKLPGGWTWARHLGQGDMISLGTIYLISLTSILCLPAAVVSFIREKNSIYAGFAVVEFLVLSLAALGIIPPG